MAITTNVFMAMFACFLWLLSILFSGNRSWVFSARKMMAFIISLLICTLTLIILGVGEINYYRIVCMFFLIVYYSSFNCASSQRAWYILKISSVLGGVRHCLLILPGHCIVWRLHYFKSYCRRTQSRVSSFSIVV